jgi:hypothetical protein
MNTIFIITTIGFAVLSALLFIKLKKYRGAHSSLVDELSLVRSQLEEQQAKLLTDASLGEVDYFKSKKDKLKFLLLEVDGKRRNQLLGITPDMYDDSQAANKWFRMLSMQVHPDRNPGDENAAKAFYKLNELYKMITL